MNAGKNKNKRKSQSSADSSSDEKAAKRSKTAFEQARRIMKSELENMGFKMVEDYGNMEWNTFKTEHAEVSTRTNTTVVVAIRDATIIIQLLALCYCSAHFSVLCLEGVPFHVAIVLYHLETHVLKLTLHDSTSLLEGCFASFRCFLVRRAVCRTLRLPFVFVFACIHSKSTCHSCCDKTGQFSIKKQALQKLYHPML